MADTIKEIKLRTGAYDGSMETKEIGARAKDVDVLFVNENTVLTDPTTQSADPALTKNMAGFLKGLGKKGGKDASELAYDGQESGVSASNAQAALDTIVGDRFKYTTINLALEGAMNDTISVYDSNDALVGSCVFDNGTTGEMELTIPSTGGDYKFVSGVAKAIDGSGEDYSKVVSLGADTTTKRLPNGYAELEYIESSGSQYIDSGVVIQTANKLETEFQLTSLPSSSVSADICGISNTGVASIIYATDGKLRYYSSTSADAVVLSANDLAKHTFKTNGRTCYFDGVAYSITSGSALTSSTLNCYLFCRNGNGSPIEYASGRMYYFKMYANDGTTLVRNLIPCRRLSDNAIGMFDLVSNTFYGNAGSGSFVGGKRVDIQSVSVMPDDSLYWYGNECTDVTGGWNLYTPESYTGASGSKFTNYIQLNNLYFAKTSNNIDISEYSKAYGLFEYINTGSRTKAYAVSIHTQSDSDQYCMLKSSDFTSLAIKSGNLDTVKTYYTNDIISIGTWGYRLNTHALWLPKKRTPKSDYEDYTILLEGAKEDKLTIYSEYGEVVDFVDFGTGATSKQVTLKLRNGGEKLTFVSSVAKSTDGSNADYYKVVSVTSSTTEVKVMPDGALYWYGNECTDKTGGYGYSGEQSSSGYSITSGVTATKNTNNITMNFTTSSYQRNVWFVTNNAIQINNQYTKLCTITELTSVSGECGTNILYSTTQPNTSGNYNGNIAGFDISASTSPTLNSANLKLTSGSGYVLFKAYANRTASFNSKRYALWLE